MLVSTNQNDYITKMNKKRKGNMHLDRELAVSNSVRYNSAQTQEKWQGVVADYVW